MNPLRLSLLPLNKMIIGSWDKSTCPFCPKMIKKGVRVYEKEIIRHGHGNVGYDVSA